MDACSKRRSVRLRLLVGAGIAAVTLTATAAGPATGRFPEARPSNVNDAVGFVSGAPGVGNHTCLTAQIGELRMATRGANPATRQALTLLQRRPALTTETLKLADGLVVRYAQDGVGTQQSSGVELRPELLAAIRLGTDQARALLSGHVGLTAPETVEVVLLDLQAGLHGYLLSADGRSGRAVIALDATPDGDGGDPRRELIHQYAHAVAMAQAAQFPIAWGEALATWAEIAVDGAPDAAERSLISRRLARLDEGLFTSDLELAAGNAVWLSFLDEAYGADVLRRAIEELAVDASQPAAMDRALRGTTPDGLASAFREFHLWTLLLGDRADRFHFSFASALAPPTFASTAVGFPSLSVQADPALASWGAAQVRLDPEDARGGMKVHFEGEFPGLWQADLLLVGKDGSKRRLAFEIPAEGRGSTTIPVDDVAEGILLLRNLAGDEVPPRRYTYAVEGDRQYPFEIVSLEATPVELGITLNWETAVEQDLVGFNVLRVREAGGTTVSVNPVWIPALGDGTSATAYHYMDSTAEPGVAYVYRIQGITRKGLTRLSDPVVARQAPR
jgi:hypothetical protein